MKGYDRVRVRSAVLPEENRRLAALTARYGILALLSTGATLLLRIRLRRALLPGI